MSERDGAWRAWGVATWLLAALACAEPSRASAARSPGGAAPQALGAGAGEEGGSAPASAPGATAEVSAARAPPRAAEPPRAPPDHEQADLDPGNDGVVAPPEPLADCAERLARAGIEYRPASLPLRHARAARGGRSERVVCGAEQVITYLGGPARLRYDSPPLVTCRLALALARFEQLALEQAALHLGQRVVGFRHLGTYSCRKMVRFDFVSEHSYANAIDIQELVLESGERLSVARHFGSLEAAPRTARARLLRSLARRAFDERLFSNVLTPFWDSLHRDHFHLDLARYRVDGAGPAEGREPVPDPSPGGAGGR